MKKPPLKRFPDEYRGRKPVLSEQEIDRLLTNPFIVEEKLDGSLMVKEYEGLTLMLEDMKVMHSVHYDKLPGRFILVDVCDGNERLTLKERRKIAKRTGYPLPPVLMVERNPVYLYETVLTKLFRLFKPMTSKFGSVRCEGFVVKSETDLSLGGKYSRLDLAGEPRYSTQTFNWIKG